MFSQEFKEKWTNRLLIGGIVFGVGYVVTAYPPAWEYAKKLLSAAGDVWEFIRTKFHIN